MRKLTTEEFIKRAKEVHGNKYDYTKTVYIDSHTKICIICPKHGEFFVTPQSHLKIGGNGGCPKCANILTKEKQISTTEEFIAKAKSVHGDKYDYSKTVYKGAKEKVCIICPKHGDFWTGAHDHLRKGRNGGCPKCASEAKQNQKRKSNTEQFIAKAKEIYGDKYDYSKVDYLNAGTKVCIICPEHGQFFITPNNHLRGHGCPICAGNVKISEDEFIKQAKEVHGNKYDYSKVKYKNSKTEVCIICPEHGEFWQLPFLHLKGSGCPNCSGLRKEYKYNLLQEFEDEYAFRAFLANNDINILQVILRNVEPKYEPLKKDIEKVLANAESMNPIRALEEKYSSDNGDDEEPIDNEPTTREEPIQNTPDLDDDDAMSEFINTMSGNNEQEEKEEPTIEEITRNREEELKVINRIEHMLTPEDREYIMNKFLNDKRRDWMANREQNK